MLPSLGRGAEDFAWLTQRLIASNYECIAIDLRGIGESTGPLTGITLHDLAADVIGVIKALRIQPVTLIGHAFGNRLARCVGADRPDLIEHIILLASGGLVDPDPALLKTFKQFLTEDLPEADYRAAIQAVHFAPTSDPTVWGKGWWTQTALAQVAATRSTPRSDWWEAGGKPLLVIQGLQDQMAVPANGRALQADFPDRVQLVEVEGAGHAILVEQPEAIATAIIKYLES